MPAPGAVPTPGTMPTPGTFLLALFLSPVALQQETQRTAAIGCPSWGGWDKGAPLT